MSVESFLQSAKKTLVKANEVSESDIENDFVTYAKNNHCKAYKLILLNLKGWPDRTVVCPGGIVFFIEFKRKNKKPSPPQLKIKAALISMGFVYKVFDKKGEAESFLDEVLAFGI